MLIMVWFLCGLAAPFVAASKGRSFIGWLILGLIFGPLALLGAAVLSRDNIQAQNQKERAGLQGGTMRRCPTCAEVVMVQASKCRFCNEILPLEKKRDWLGREID